MSRLPTDSESFADLLPRDPVLLTRRHNLGARDPIG
jgi:hypothetical protein